MKGVAFMSEKKKKGFTLVELIAVVVILGIILVIAVPRITDVISTTRESGYQANERMMVNAVRNYLVINDSKNPGEIGTMSVITTGELQESEFIGPINDTSDFSIECDGYVVVKYTEGNTFDYTPYLKCGNNYQTEGYTTQSLQSIEVLVVAGGGGGGAVSGGGGGAGGLVFNNNYAVFVGEVLSVNVGAGGGGGIDRYIRGANGSNSAFGTIEAIGGGGGGSISSRTGLAGGSGGGANSRPTSNGGTAVLSSTQGNSGGNGIGSDTTSSGSGSGGGGFSQKGQDTPDEWHAGTGGNGWNGSSLFGTNYGENGWFAAGGGGGYSNHHYNPAGYAGLGGQGGGGSGASGSNNGQDALANTGGGGGGGGYDGNSWTGGSGGSGGSGIVLVRYLGHQKANGGIVTTDNGYTIHAFIKVGEYSFKTLGFN